MFVCCIHALCAFFFKAPLLVSSVLLSFMKVWKRNISMIRAFSCCQTNHCMDFRGSWAFKGKSTRCFFLVSVQQLLGKKERSSPLKLFPVWSGFRIPCSWVPVGPKLKIDYGLYRQRTVKVCFQTTACLHSVADFNARVRRFVLMPQ